MAAAVATLNLDTANQPLLDQQGDETNPAHFAYAVGPSSLHTIRNIEQVQVTSLELDHTQRTIEPEWSRVYFDEGIAVNSENNAVQWSIGNHSMTAFLPPQHLVITDVVEHNAANGHVVWVLASPHGYSFLPSVDKYVSLSHNHIFTTQNVHQPLPYDRLWCPRFTVESISDWTWKVGSIPGSGKEVWDLASDDEFYWVQMVGAAWKDPSTGKVTLQSQLANRYAHTINGRLYIARYDSTLKAFLIQTRAALPAQVSEKLQGHQVYFPSAEVLAELNPLYVAHSGTVVVLNAIDCGKEEVVRPGDALVTGRIHNLTDVCSLINANVGEWTSMQHACMSRTGFAAYLWSCSLRVTFDSKTGLFCYAFASDMFHMLEVYRLSRPDVVVSGSLWQRLVDADQAVVRLFWNQQQQRRQLGWRMEAEFGPYNDVCYVALPPQNYVSQPPPHPLSFAGHMTQAGVHIVLQGGRFPIQTAYPPYNFPKGAIAHVTDRTVYTPFFAGGNYTVADLAEYIKLFLTTFLRAAGYTDATCLVRQVSDPDCVEMSRLCIESSVPLLLGAGLQADISSIGGGTNYTGAQTLTAQGLPLLGDICYTIQNIKRSDSYVCINVNNNPKIGGTLLTEIFPTATNPRYVYVQHGVVFNGLFRVFKIDRDANAVWLATEDWPVYPRVRTGTSDTLDTFDLELDDSLEPMYQHARLFFTDDPNYKPRNPCFPNGLWSFSGGSGSNGGLGGSDFIVVGTNGTATEALGGAMGAAGSGNSMSLFNVSQLFDMAPGVMPRSCKTCWYTKPFFGPTPPLPSPTSIDQRYTGVLEAGGCTALSKTPISSGPTMRLDPLSHGVSISRKMLQRGAWKGADSVGPLPLVHNVTVVGNATQCVLVLDTLPEDFVEGTEVRIGSDQPAALTTWFQDIEDFYPNADVSLPMLASYMGIRTSASPRKNILLYTLGNDGVTREPVLKFKTTFNGSDRQPVNLWLYFGRRPVGKRSGLCTSLPVASASAFGQTSLGSLQERQKYIPFTSGMKAGSALVTTPNELADASLRTDLQMRRIASSTFQASTLEAPRVFRTDVSFVLRQSDQEPLIRLRIPSHLLPLRFSRYQLACVSQNQKQISISSTTGGVSFVRETGHAYGSQNIYTLTSNYVLPVVFYQEVTLQFNVDQNSGRYLTLPPVGAPDAKKITLFALSRNNAAVAGWTSLHFNYIPGGRLSAHVHLDAPLDTDPLVHSFAFLGPRTLFATDRLVGDGTTEIQDVDVCLVPVVHEPLLMGDMPLVEQVLELDGPQDLFPTQRSGSLTPMMEADTDADVLNVYLIRKEAQFKQAPLSKTAYGWDRSIRASLLGFPERVYQYGLTSADPGHGAHWVQLEDNTSASWGYVPPFISHHAPDFDFPSYILLVMKAPGQQECGLVQHPYDPAGDSDGGGSWMVLAKLSRLEAVHFADRMAMRDIHSLPGVSEASSTQFSEWTRTASSITLELRNPDMTLYKTHGRHWSVTLDLTLSHQ